MCNEIFSHVVGVVSGYMTNPGEAMKRVLWYLEAQMDKGSTICFFYSFMVNHVLQEVGVTIEFMVFIILCFGLLVL